MGVVRHADAGYDNAISTALARGVDMPMLRRDPAEPT
jgi:urocanate hydratase